MRDLLAIFALSFAIVGVAHAAPADAPVEQPSIRVEVESKKEKTEEVAEKTPPPEQENNPNKCDLAGGEIMWEDKSCHAQPQPPVAPQSQITGTKEDWLTQAGIPQDQWWAVDYIVTRESSWNPLAVNPNGGACGLAQSLPCEKIAQSGLDWSNPVHALKWQYEYVKNRHGGYAGAYEFWLANQWY